MCVALAFADASIVVLALPQIVERLHTSVSHVVWVIVAYNLALIAGSLAILPFARRLASPKALCAGLALFGLASIGCGAAQSLSLLIPMRCAQGAGGALVLAASLPLFAGITRPGQSPLHGWAAAAAIGAAVGPAAGGVLTQVFDWRAIFFAQAPVAALAAAAVLASRPRPPEQLGGGPMRLRATLDPVLANLSLTFMSAGVIGALFLVVLEMIDGWLVSPIGAAAIVTTLPIAVAIAERSTRGSSSFVLGALGAVLLAIGLFGLSLISHRQLGWVVVALAIAATGVGIGFPGLTAAALQRPGEWTARAARTVAARDLGIVLGLLVLTPIFVDQVNNSTSQATRQITGEVILAPIPLAKKVELGAALQAAANSSGTNTPDLGPAFAKASAGATPAVRAQLSHLEQTLNSIAQRSATHVFKKPYEYAALGALLVLPLLAMRLVYLRRRVVPVRG